MDGGAPEYKMHSLTPLLLDAGTKRTRCVLHVNLSVLAAQLSEEVGCDLRGHRVRQLPHPRYGVWDADHVERAGDAEAFVRQEEVRGRAGLARGEVDEFAGGHVCAEDGVDSERRGSC